MPKKIGNSATIVDLGQMGDDDQDPKKAQKQIADMGSFFETLERQVNGAVFEEEVEDDNKSAAVQLDDIVVDDYIDEEEASEEDGSDVDKELENYKKRYEDSSSEAKRLYNRLQELENYVPLLDEFRNDPGLIEHVKSYLNKENQPQTGLDLPEDFIFDYQEAIEDPSSDSAKVWNTMIDRAVDAKLNQKLRKEREVQQIHESERSQEAMVKDFQKKHKMSDDEIGELIEWSKNQPLTLDHIYLIKNWNKIQKNLTKRSLDDETSQRAKMGGLPRTLAKKGNASNEASADEELFRAIMQAEEGTRIF